MPTTLRRLSCLLLVAASLGLSGCGEKAPKVDVSAQIAALDSTTAEGKQDALTELAKAGPAAAPAVPKLIVLLKDQDAVTRRLTAYALGQIGTAAKSALPALNEAMNGADRDFSTSLVNAIRAVEGKGGPAVPNVAN